MLRAARMGRSIRSARRGRIRRGLFAGAAALAGAALAAAGPARAAQPTVILISLDGTGPEAIRESGLEALPGLALRGAEAEALLPVFPTNTFPNHVSLVTGVAPDVHGIVNNSFLDPERGVYERSADPRWIEVEPLWSILEGQGVATASFHWVGSEGAWTSGRGPRHWRPFDSRTGEREKVEQILAWLDLADPRERPRLITAWFHGADGAAHRHGPGTPEVRGALREQDRAVARLVAGLEERGAFAWATLLFVSDHGMAEVRERVDLEAALGAARVRARTFGGGGFATAVLPGGLEAARRAASAARAAGLEAWPRGEAPAELRVGHPRFGDVVVLAPPGVAIAKRLSPQGALRGVHGYRPEAPGMAGLLLAAGRGAVPGTRLGRPRALDVAPTVLALLGLPAPAWMEGRAIAALLPKSEDPGAPRVPEASP